MLDAIDSFKDFFRRKNTITDNRVFRLHYKTTVVVLVAFSVLVTTKQFIGEPINCFTSTKDVVPKDVLESFCWIHSTFTIPSARSNANITILAPGVTKYQAGQGVKYHRYYQWVGFILIIQAIFFYLPHYFWSTIEKGKLKMLQTGLAAPRKPDCTKYEKRFHALLNYLQNTHCRNNFYANWFFFCELLNFIVVTVQIFATDYFLDHEFRHYGLRVISFMEMDPEDRVDPMIEIFPRMTKCRFHKYGPSGELNQHDALCVLPLNIINEKIYIVLWFWFIILAVLSGLVVLYRILLLISVRFQSFIFVNAINHLANNKKLTYVIYRGRIGDWLLMVRIAENIDPVTFSALVLELYDWLEESQKILIKLKSSKKGAGKMELEKLKDHSEA